MKYLERVKPAQSLQGTTVPETGKINKGVNNDSLLGDTGQGSTQPPSSGGTHPTSEVRGGRGEQAEEKRARKVLEKWPFLAEQASSLTVGSSRSQRGKGKERKPEGKRGEKIATPGEKHGRKK